MTPQDVVSLYRTGSYGTPDAPIRSSSVKRAFWAGYFGHPAPSKGSINHEAAVAGRWMKKES